MGTKALSGDYLRVEEFRRILGYKSAQPIYRAIKQGRLPGAANVGTKENPRWIIPATAHIINRQIKHGGYIGYTARIREAKRKYLTHGDTE